MSRGMRSKTIGQVLTKKTDKWLETIEDEDLRNKCRSEMVITGGSIASMLLGEEVNDYDIYFKTYKTAVEVAKYYLDRFIKNRTAVQGGIPYSMEVQELVDTHGRDRVRIVIKSAGVAGEEQKQDYEYFETRDTDTEAAGEYVQEAMGEVTKEAQVDKTLYEPIFLSSNAITLRGDIQLVLRFYGDPEQIHDNYDFVHCTNYWTKKDGVVLNQDALEALMSKTLVYRGSLYPVCSIFRVKKFTERGWKINAGQQLKMILQCSELNLTDPVILEEQLTGVDVAYFSEILSKCKQKENPLVVETAYLTEIIDRMFS